MNAEQLNKALVIDVETSSIIDLTKTGTHRYAHHASTRILCAAFSSVTDTQPPQVWIPGTDPPAALVHHLFAGGVVAAWNAAFDVAILNRFLPAGIPRIKVQQVHDIAAQAASAALPRKLEQCCTALKLTQNKDKLGHAAMRYFMRPRKWNGITPVWVRPEDDPARFALLVRYCQQDVLLERLLMRELPQLQAISRPVFENDMVINARGIRIDRRLINDGGPALIRSIDEANAVIAGLTQDQPFKIQKVTNAERIVKLLQHYGVELILAKPRKKQVNAENDGEELKQQAQERTGEDPEETPKIGDNKPPSMRGALSRNSVEAMLARTDLPPVIREVLLLRQGYARTSTAKLRSIAITMSPEDDRTHDYIVFHGAATGRAAGRLIQPQNLPRDSIAAEVWSGVLDDLTKLDNAAFVAKHKATPVGAVVTLIRGAIVPAPGHVLCGGDFSKIELCVGAWLAGQADLLKALRAGVDVYRGFAADSIYSCPLAEIDEYQRQIAKSAVLGCQFQLGGEAFQSYLLATAKVSIPLAQAEAIVKAFRATYDRYRPAWQDAGRAAIAAVTRPGTDYPTLGGKVVFRCTPNKRWLLMILPSGRRLRYPLPEVVDRTTPWGTVAPTLFTWGVSQFTHQWARESRHGGVLFQNATQAIAVDILTGAVHRAEVAGLRPILHVHDEILCEPPADFGVTHREIRELMIQRLPWYGDLPVDAEVWIGERYGKPKKLTGREIAAMSQQV